jgi:hypothetical protein
VKNVFGRFGEVAIVTDIRVFVDERRLLTAFSVAPFGSSQ